MHIVHSLDEIPKLKAPIALSIGNFDGFHLGHQAVLKRLLEKAGDLQTQAGVLTFSNHPSAVIRPSHQTPLLCTIAHKMHLLSEIGIDLTLLLPFTQAFSEQSASEFLTHLHQILPFQILILGSDAHMGKNREGDRQTIMQIAHTTGFHVEYIPDYHLNGQRISSSAIRHLIQRGDLSQAAVLLGRPYSINGPVLPGKGRGASLGFPTANLSVENLCLPPLGVYAVTISVNGKIYPGVANLGFAPTVRQEKTPLLEVHIFDHQEDLYGKEIDVYFGRFIRSEKRFEDIEELKKQIAADILKAKRLHHDLKKLETQT